MRLINGWDLSYVNSNGRIIYACYTRYSISRKTVVKLVYTDNQWIKEENRI